MQITRQKGEEMKSTGREMKRTESFEGKGFKELWATNQEVSNTLDLWY